MRTQRTVKCEKCGHPVVTRLRDVQENTTTPYSLWRIDEIADCPECGHLEIIEKGKPE